MVVFKLSLLSEKRQSIVSAPKGSETGLKLPLTAHHLRLYSFFGYSVIALELRETCVDCVDLVPLLDHFEKHLPAHHLRLHILFMAN